MFQDVFAKDGQKPVDGLNIAQPWWQVSTIIQVHLSVRQSGCAPWPLVLGGLYPNILDHFLEVS